MQLLWKLKKVFKNIVKTTLKWKETKVVGLAIVEVYDYDPVFCVNFFSSWYN